MRFWKLIDRIWGWMSRQRVSRSRRLEIRSRIKTIDDTSLMLALRRAKDNKNDGG